jgi:hypothetical protein
MPGGAAALNGHDIVANRDETGCGLSPTRDRALVVFARMVWLVGE